MSDRAFRTAEEVKAYCAGDLITCLECGRSLKMLCTHLQVHGMGELEYREKYNIPPSIKLMGRGTLTKMAAGNKTPHDVLRERQLLIDRSVSRPGPNAMFSQRVADMGRTVAASAKTKINEPRVREAHALYMAKTQRAACDYLGISPPTLHKWFDRLGLPKKCPPIPL